MAKENTINQEHQTSLLFNISDIEQYLKKSVINELKQSIVSQISNERNYLGIDSAKANDFSTMITHGGPWTAEAAAKRNIAFEAQKSLEHDKEFLANKNKEEAFLKQQHSQERQKLEMSQRLELKQLEEKHKTLISDQLVQHKTERSALESHYKVEAKALKTNHLSELQNIRNNLRAELSQSWKSFNKSDLDSIRDSQKLQLQKLQNEHRLALQMLDEKYQQEKLSKKSPEELDELRGNYLYNRDEMLEEQSQEIANLKFEHRNELRAASLKESNSQLGRKSAVREIIDTEKNRYSSRRTELYSTKIAAKANLLFKQNDEQKLLLVTISREITVLHLRHEQQSMKLANKQMQEMVALHALHDNHLFSMRPKFTYSKKQEDDEGDEEEDDYSASGKFRQ